MSQSRGLATQKKDNCSGMAEQSQPTCGSKALTGTKVCTSKCKTNGTFWLTSTQLRNTSPYCKLVTSTPHSALGLIIWPCTSNTLLALSTLQFKVSKPGDHVVTQQYRIFSSRKWELCVVHIQRSKCPCWESIEGWWKPKNGA